MPKLREEIPYSAFAAAKAACDAMNARPGQSRPAEPCDEDDVYFLRREPAAYRDDDAATVMTIN